MRFIVLVVIVCFTFNVQSRPTQNEGDQRVSEEEVEYEVDPDEKDSRLQPEVQDPVNEQQNKRIMEMLKNPYAPKVLNKVNNPDEVSDFKLTKNKQEREINTNKMGNDFEGFQFPTRRQTSRYLNNDFLEQQDPLRLASRNANPHKADHNSILTNEAPNKRTLQEPKTPLNNNDNDMLFEKDDKIDYNNEPVETNHRAPKHYYSVMQRENRVVNDGDHDIERLYYNRDRRNVENSQPDSPQRLTNLEDQDQKENINPSDAEDGESAIKKQIQKLSSEELQDLMNSLSEDKRNLLKKIVDDSNLTKNDAVHKREITKKAEAVQDNGYNEDTKMLTGSISVTDSVESLSTDAPDANKQVESSKSDTSDTPNTKNSELSNDQSKSMYTFQDPNVQQISDDAVSPSSNIESDKSKIVSIEPASAKSTNKREINENDLADRSKDDQSYSSSQDQDSQNLDDGEQLQFVQEMKTFKRDVDQQAELDSKMKSLEDSFPNSDSYDESSGPLVRVKRTDAVVNLKKRCAASLPESKVAFVPYRSENDDDDEEGNEFDDEGFYERAHVCNKNVEESAPVKQYGNERPTNENQQAQISEFNKDSKVGTDTDSVLSGMNEVDENLMFNSGRNRRTTEDNNLSNNEDLNAQSGNTKSSDDANKVIFDNVNNGPNYQESDSFGPLPQSYGGDLGRYKRIRRVKQSHAEEPASDTQVS